MDGQAEVRHFWSQLVCVVIAVVVVGAIVYRVLTASISALPEPGHVEIWVATSVRNWYIRRGASHSSIHEPGNSPAEVSVGEGLFSMACASCHGKDGRNPTNIGRAMYPRAYDLAAPEVQHLTNPELFWVVKNGIRLSGMPAFGKILSDDETWQVTYYVRSLGKSP